MATKTTHLSRTPRLYDRAGFMGSLGKLALAYSIWRERQHLATLDDTLLSDIGKTRDEARREANRPVWDAPSRWFL